MNQINRLLSNLGVPLEARREMYDPLLSFLCSHPCISSFKLEEYLARNKRGFRSKNQSLADYLLEHDHDHIEDWKYYLGISDKDMIVYDTVYDQV